MGLLYYLFLHQKASSAQEPITWDFRFIFVTVQCAKKRAQLTPRDAAHLNM